MDIPNKPGWGVELNEEAFKSMPPAPWRRGTSFSMRTARRTFNSPMVLPVLPSSSGDGKETLGSSRHMWPRDMMSSPSITHSKPKLINVGGSTTNSFGLVLFSAANEATANRRMRQHFRAIMATRVSEMGSWRTAVLGNRRRRRAPDRGEQGRPAFISTQAGPAVDPRMPA